MSTSDVQTPVLGSGRFLSPCLVAELPAAAADNLGWRGVVINGTVTLTAGIGATVAGVGANVVPVFSDGAAWKIG